MHPFFWDNEELDRRIVLPEIPLHAGLTDVAISYQSAQVMDMKRLVRCLNAVGISTKDGTMVMLLDLTILHYLPQTEVSAWCRSQVE